MSRGGVAVDRVVACPGIGSGQAADMLVSTVGQHGGYHAVRVASDRVQFARTFRPTWATVLGWCTIIFAFVGVLFFFVKTTETCIAVVEADHRGTRIRLSGRLDADVLQRLLVAFDDPAGAARDAAVAAAVGAPVNSANPSDPFGPFGSSVPASAPLASSPPPQTAPGPAAPVTGVPVSMAPPSGVPANLAPPAGVPVSMAPPSGAPVQMDPPVGNGSTGAQPSQLPPAYAGPAQQTPPVAQTPPPYGGPSNQPPASAGPTPQPVFPTTPEPPSTGWVPVWERDDLPLTPEPATPSPASPGSGSGFDPSSTIVVPKRSNTGGTTLRAVLDDGTDLDLSTVVLLGRDPSVGAGDGNASAVAVADPEKTVSKTHLKVELLGGVVLVTDRGSTNGSALVAADGSERELEPGVPTEVPSGCVVRFGTRTFRVLSSGAIGAPL